MFNRRKLRYSAAFSGAALLCASAFSVSHIQAQSLPTEKQRGKLELVHRFYGPMPTGVTVSQRGRIFVNFPRWGDDVPFTVAEIKNGRAVPYPNRAFNQFATNGSRGRVSLANSEQAQRERATHLVSVQSVVVDPADRLWLLDTGSIAFGPTAMGGPKLVGVDLKTNRVFKTIYFDRDVALPTTYLNDVRFDLRRGRGGVAYITDSGAKSPGGIIVVDLATGIATRRLSGHPSVQAEPKFVPVVEGDAMYQTRPNQFPTYVGIKSDGIAISADGSRLFYCPLASRRLYSVSTSALLNGKASDAVVGNTVVDHGDKGMSDGLESDAQGRVYVTQVEHNAIARRMPNSLYEPVVHDPRLLWPDTLSVANDGYLYVIANQLHRQKGFNHGKDLRKKPYSLFRTKIDGTPVMLK